MGDGAKLITEGLVCESCWVYIGEAVGYPRKCKECKKEESNS